MSLVNDSAGIGTAGLVLARLLLEPPSQAMAANFDSPQMRASWPLQDSQSSSTLDRLVEGSGPYQALIGDHAALFRHRPPLVALRASAWRTDGAGPAALAATLAEIYRRDGVAMTNLPTPVDDHVGYQLTYVADLVTRAGRATANGDAATASAAAARSLQFRQLHLDPVVEPILEAIELYARTQFYRAVPGLLRGFLAQHTALCTQPTMAH